MVYCCRWALCSWVWPLGTAGPGGCVQVGHRGRLQIHPLPQVDDRVYVPAGVLLGVLDVLHQHLAVDLGSPDDKADHLFSAGPVPEPVHIVVGVRHSPRRHPGVRAGGKHALNAPAVAPGLPGQGHVPHLADVHRLDALPCPPGVALGRHRQQEHRSAVQKSEYFFHLSPAFSPAPAAPRWRPRSCPPAPLHPRRRCPH